MCVYRSLWSPVCGFDLLMNPLNTHLCFKDIRMFNHTVEKYTHTHTHTAVCCCCNPHPGFVPFNSFLSWLLCLVIMSAVVSGRFLQRWRQRLMSTSCSSGQPNNGNPRELKLNLYRTRFAGKKSRTALYARTTAQRGASILPSHLYLVRILFCWGSSVFTGLILGSVKHCP